MLATFALFLALRDYLFEPSGLFLVTGSASKFFWESLNTGYQFLFWKCRPIFLFLIQPNLGQFCTFGALSGINWGWYQIQKCFLGLTYIANQLWFLKYSHIFFDLATFGASFTLFKPFKTIVFWHFGAIFSVGVQFKNMFGADISRQSTLVLEIQPYFFETFGAIFEVCVRFKKNFWSQLTSTTNFYFGRITISLL